MKQFYEALRKARNISQESVDDKYYLKSYKDNIYGEMPVFFYEMFWQGYGSELKPGRGGEKPKAAALHSSSMLAYNFFHWISEETPLTYEGVIYDKVVFEEKLRVLKGNNMANMDIVLVSKDNNTVLFLESKFTEHLEMLFTRTYHNPTNYLSQGETWSSVIRTFNLRSHYYAGIKQIMCHLMGINNLAINQDALNWFNKNSWLNKVYGITLKGDENYIFKSIVFQPNDPELKSLTESYMDLVRREAQEFSFLKDNIKVIPNPIITYGTLWEESIKASIKDQSLIEYLNGYLSVHTTHD